MRIYRITEHASTIISANNTLFIIYRIYLITIDFAKIQLILIPNKFIVVH